MIGIYKITNKLNGKSYIGQSIHCGKRLDEHCKGDQLIDQIIQIEGVDNFTFEILKETNKNELSVWEDFYIIKYNTMYPNGYNKRWNCSEELRKILTNSNIKELELDKEQEQQNSKYSEALCEVIKNSKVLNEKYYLKERIDSFEKFEEFKSKQEINKMNRVKISPFLRDIQVGDCLTSTSKNHVNEIKKYVDKYNNKESLWGIPRLPFGDYSYVKDSYGIPVYTQYYWTFEKDKMIKEIKIRQRSQIIPWITLFDKGILNPEKVLFYSKEKEQVEQSELINDYRKIEYLIIIGEDDSAT